MPLDPQTKAYLDEMAALNMPAMSAFPPEVIRQGIAAQFAQAPAGEPVAKVENRTIPGPAGEIPVRIYTPEGTGPFPLLVYFHGGGWVICTLDTHDGQCRSLTNGAGCVVVSVDYRLAPEHKFPAAPQDCYAATCWVAEHAAELNGDPTRLAIGGDSAGGNLTAVVAQMARDQGGPRLIFQLLIYPATDFTAQTASKKENAQGYFLTLEDMHWFEGHYLNSEADRLNPLASPMLASDLSHLPPALVLTAEYDPLRDEGELYGQRLQAAGVPVTMRRYNGLIHGFFGQAAIVDEARRAVTETGQTLREVFAAQ
ncbi:MAG TPA: alpha/beta hydrolase fold domain-containing protein [Ktedonobacteraceae bacterium]|nr:alpha/beta hydrolase fold domain-containing protein [Ktedonobacteraceae bacterium]